MRVAAHVVEARRESLSRLLERHRYLSVPELCRRLGISEDAARAEVSRRMAAQISDEEKIKAADFVIDNSGSLEATKRQVQRVFHELHPGNETLS